MNATIEDLIEMGNRREKLLRWALESGRYPVLLSRISLVESTLKQYANTVEAEGWGSKQATIDMMTFSQAHLKLNVMMAKIQMDYDREMK